MRKSSVRDTLRSVEVLELRLSLSSLSTGDLSAAVTAAPAMISSLDNDPPPDPEPAPPVNPINGPIQYPTLPPSGPLGPG